ncbi:MAG: hypothetical protein VYE22_39660 [Myxococcota bacterium]|nr:hypothetical protein [Myxococcota bacterium]
MKRTILLAVMAYFALTGCAGHEAVEGSSAALEQRPAQLVPEWQWRVADPCGEQLPAGVVWGTAGEAGLGAVVGPHGAVLCVDALFRLQPEAPARWQPTSGTFGEEPTPEPM